MAVVVSMRRTLKIQDGKIQDEARVSTLSLLYLGSHRLESCIFKLLHPTSALWKTMDNSKTVITDMQAFDTEALKGRLGALRRYL
jgi:hypothetical protein